MNIIHWKLKEKKKQYQYWFNKNSIQVSRVHRNSLVRKYSSSGSLYKRRKFLRWYLYSLGLLQRTRFIFDIHSLSSPRAPKQEKKNWLDPIGLPARPLFTTAGLAYSYYYNSRLECCRTLEVCVECQPDARERVKPVKILEETRCTHEQMVSSYSSGL